MKTLVLVKSMVLPFVVISSVLVTGCANSAPDIYKTTGTTTQSPQTTQAPADNNPTKQDPSAQASPSPTPITQSSPVAAVPGCSQKARNILPLDPSWTYKGAGSYTACSLSGQATQATLSVTDSSNQTTSTGTDSFGDPAPTTPLTPSIAATRIELHGDVDSNTHSVCIFPGIVTQYQATTGTQKSLRFVQDQYRLPSYTCINLPTTTDQIMVAEFDNTQINYLFIVRSDLKDQMKNCLALNQPGNCPVYSSGQYR